MRGKIGGGQRAVVGLVVDVETGVVDAQDLRRGFARGGDDGLAQRVSQLHGAAGIRARCTARRWNGLRINPRAGSVHRSEEHTSELQSLMRNSYAAFCLNKKRN